MVWAFFLGIKCDRPERNRVTPPVFARTFGPELAKRFRAIESLKRGLLFSLPECVAMGRQELDRERRGSRRWRLYRLQQSGSRVVLFRFGHVLFAHRAIQLTLPPYRRTWCVSCSGLSRVCVKGDCLWTTALVASSPLASEQYCDRLRGLFRFLVDRSGPVTLHDCRARHR